MFPHTIKKTTSLMFACFLGTMKVATSLVTIGFSHTCFIYKTMPITVCVKNYVHKLIGKPAQLDNNKR